ncbi:MAG TPA: translational GTPase TypA [Chitinispirillaceae bacterium]|nr:translational GTPase TypA [Chitinispirillaceae bacterium]
MHSIRNIAIIAHVDHGKTTLVDQLFKQSGMFRKNQAVEERLMDSIDLEKERGITITSKNGSFRYKGHLVNVIDTPGHADFGGQVERILKMADGALLLVDAREGPMPQTHFVLKKALALALPVIVVINKIDKSAIRPEWVIDQVFDLFVKLNAPDNILDFPFIYCSAKDGYARRSLNDDSRTLEPLYKMIIEHIPSPKGNSDAPLQMLVSSIDYSPYMGRLGIGKITEGTLNVNKDIAVALRDGSLIPARISKVYRFEGVGKVAVETAATGDIVAVAGMDEVTVGVTFTDPLFPNPLPPLQIDPPTISMNFIPNDSPFAGKDGRFVTSRHLEDRLRRETLSDIALVVEELSDSIGYKVSGRGELHLSILIERMRREGYEFQVTRPQVIFKHENDKKLEPYEELTIDVDENYLGIVLEKMGMRKGKVLQMSQDNGMTKVVFKVPTRGLLGYRCEFMTDTRGMGIMNYVFLEYGSFAGDIKTRNNGVMIAKESCTTVAYALYNLQNRGKMFVGPGVNIYRGQIVGEHCRNNDLVVNPGKEKKLSNMRAAGSDENILLTPAFEMTLEDCISYVNDDELVEITPNAIRLRKRV